MHCNLVSKWFRSAKRLNWLNTKTSSSRRSWPMSLVLVTPDHHSRNPTEISYIVSLYEMQQSQKWSDCNPVPKTHIVQNKCRWQESCRKWAWHTDTFSGQYVSSRLCMELKWGLQKLAKIGCRCVGSSHKHHLCMASYHPKMMSRGSSGNRNSTGSP